MFIVASVKSCTSYCCCAFSQEENYRRGGKFRSTIGTIVAIRNICAQMEKPTLEQLFRISFSVSFPYAQKCLIAECALPSVPLEPASGAQHAAKEALPLLDDPAALLVSKTGFVADTHKGACVRKQRICLVDDDDW
jgi:hypothetical protein